MPPFQLLKVFDVVPGWVYAAALLALALVIGADRIALADAHRDAAVAQSGLQADRAGAQQALAKQTALVLKATNELQSLRLAQEKRDGEAQATIARLGEDLRRASRAGGGGGLRDPNAPSCSGQPAAGSGPAAGAGGGGAAEAGGLLSAQLEGLLLRLTGEADDVNAAYASCRADALTLRATIKQLSPPSPAPQVPSP